MVGRSKGDEVADSAGLEGTRGLEVIELEENAARVC